MMQGLAFTVGSTPTTLFNTLFQKLKHLPAVLEVKKKLSWHAVWKVFSVLSDDVKVLIKVNVTRIFESFFLSPYFNYDKNNLHNHRHPLEALAKTRPSVSSKTLTEDRLESVESRELCGGEFLKWVDKKSGATAATSSRKLRLSMPSTESGKRNNWSISGLSSGLSGSVKSLSST